MFTAGDVKRWAEEADAALRGSYVHRAWRTEDTWVLLVRFHEDGDPQLRSISRVAFEIALPAEFGRCVAVTPEWVNADDKKAKKAWGKDGHPFLTALRKHLAGCKVTGVEQLADDRIAQVQFERVDAPPGDETAAEPDDGPRLRGLSVELIGRTGNLILTGRGSEDSPVVVVKALNAGRRGRPFPPGEAYELPPPRPGGARAEPALVPDVAVDPETLAVGMATAAHQRALATDAAQRSRKGGFNQALKRAVKRCQGILKKLEAQLADVARADEFERKGNLIKANLGSLPRQAAKITVIDYGAPEPNEVELELDGSKTVQDAMKAFFKKAKKLRSGEIHVLTRQGETDAQLVELKALRERLSEIDADDDDALDVIEAELLKRAVIKKAQPGKAKNKQQVNQGPRRFVSAEGHDILVGRNDDENDKLTMRTARGRDLFFHVRGCPGSHVIMRVDPKRPPNHESLLDAASLAAYYSKARQRGTVEVSYTPRKWVKKPKGAKPGLVQISNAKSVRASGGGERIKRVLSTLKPYED